MRAKFIGTDGSMGLKAGVIYDIAATNFHGYPLAIDITMSSTSESGHQLCPYSSFEQLFMNWKFLNKEVDL